MNTLVEDDVKKKYTDTYTELVRGFCVDKSILDIASKYPFNEHNQAPAPFLPIIGSGYFTATIRVAIYGMETLHWHDLSKFVDKFSKADENPLARVKKYTDGNEDGTEIKSHKDNQRFHVHHAVPWYKKNNFWGFAYSALACIHGVSVKTLKKKDSTIEKSFIWGNVHAYERFSKTPKKVGMSREDWEIVYKEASKRFDSAQLLLPYTRPQIMVVFHWAMTRKWLTGKEGDWEPSEKIPFDWQDFSIEHSLTEEQTKNLVHYIRCYYLAETKTFILHTMHPSGMNPNHKYWKGNGIEHDIWKSAIRHALRQIMKNEKFSSQS